MPSGNMSSSLLKKYSFEDREGDRITNPLQWLQWSVDCKFSILTINLVNKE